MSGKWFVGLILLPLGCSSPAISVEATPSGQGDDFLIRYPRDVSAALVTITWNGQNLLWQIKPGTHDSPLHLTYGQLPAGAVQIFPEGGASPLSIPEGEVVWVFVSCSGGDSLTASASTADQFRKASGRFIKLRGLPVH